MISATGAILDDAGPVIKEGGVGPKVSVIIIFLDAAGYLAEAVESVFSQTMDDWELILVDDGSSDDSTDLARTYASASPRVRYVDHPSHANLGMSASRNLGLKNARGSYVAFLDADDVYLPERLERHVEILDRMDEVVMVQSDLVHWYSWEPEERRVDDDYVRPFLGAGDHILKAPDGLIVATAVPLYSAGICNITVRREIALRVGGFEAQFRSMYEDQVFLAKIYLEYAVYVMQAYLARYRRHAGSWSRKVKKTGEHVDGLPSASTRMYHAWLREYVREKGASDPLLLETIQRLGATEPRGLRRNLQPLVRSVVAVGKQTLPRLLSRDLHRSLLRWNRRREFRLAQSQYAALSDRLNDAETCQLGRK
jgi:glycosyltransferase involved in cell wall biosynthesis